MTTVTLSKNPACQMFTEADIYLNVNDTTTAPLDTVPAFKYVVKSNGEELASGIVSTTGKIHLLNVELTLDPVDYDIYLYIDSSISLGYFNNKSISAYIYAESTQTSTIPEPVSFSEDSWATIAKAVKSGDYPYEVGDTKTITIASHTNDCASFTGSGASYQCISQVEPEKTVTLRVANTTECTNGETSETACGFVVEFADIIENHNMNPANATNTAGTNIGGWPATAMRTYLNSTILNALPSDLQNVISNTTVISGHGSADTGTTSNGNWQSSDKLYLLSPKEVWGLSGDSPPQHDALYDIIKNDTAYDETRQLDYYVSHGVSYSNITGAIKKYNGSDTYWYLRATGNEYNNIFITILPSGGSLTGYSRYTHGVSPAFRIAGRPPKPKSFATDSWSTIATAVKSGKYPYEVGDTKTITVASHTNDCVSSSGSGSAYQCTSQVEPEKTVTLRVANTSECTNGETSQTACGFVVEFADIIENHNMNPGGTYPYTFGKNVGGWPATSMQTYLNSTILNALPSDLQPLISDTTVISSHGSTSGETNFTSTDKLYLLSTKEVWGKSGTSNVINYDTAESETRQLDYYASNGVSTSSYENVIKQYNGSNFGWFLRSATGNYDDAFFNVQISGLWLNCASGISSGISPAFRIAPDPKPQPKSFAEDSWDTISKAVKSGDYPYEVGDTKTITIASHTNDCASSTGSGASYQCISQVEPEKTVTLRVANTSECTNGETSQTACGFVIEFADIVENHNMNPANATYTYGTNVGGWPATAMRTYLNSTILNALPPDLQPLISNTTVVSSHGSTSGETNFTSTDKLYLLAPHEVWGDKQGYDSAYDNTRQLDYYEQEEVTTTTNKEIAIKKQNNVAQRWWLRGASSSYNVYFFYAHTTGSLYDYGNAFDMRGIAPAFRL